MLFTSAVTRDEIYFGRLDLDKKTMRARLMRPSNVQEISADPGVYGRASSIRKYHEARKQKIKLPNAMKLATSVRYRAGQFQTMDGLQNDGTKHRKLSNLNGDVRRVQPENCYPMLAAPRLLRSLRKARYFRNKEMEQRINEPTTTPKESDELQANPAHPSTIQGSNSGRT